MEKSLRAMRAVENIPFIYVSNMRLGLGGTLCRKLCNQPKKNLYIPIGVSVGAAKKGVDNEIETVTKQAWMCVYILAMK